MRTTDLDNASAVCVRSEFMRWWNEKIFRRLIEAIDTNRGSVGVILCVCV